MKKILRNAVRCKKCGDIIESKTRHDFQTCACGNVSVDGGHLYLKRCFKRGAIGECYEELSEYEEEEGWILKDSKKCFLMYIAHSASIKIWKRDLILVMSA